MRRIRKETYQCPLEKCSYTSRLSIGGHNIPEDKGHSSSTCPIHREKLIRMGKSKKQIRKDNNRRIRQKPKYS